MRQLVVVLIVAVVIVALSASVGYAQSLVNTKTLRVGAFTENTVKTSVLSGEVHGHHTSGNGDDDENGQPTCGKDDDEDDDERTHTPSGKGDDDEDDDDDCVPPSVITSADVAFELESQIRDPDGTANTRDEYFANVIKACIFRSNEPIQGHGIMISCKLTDNSNDVKNADGTVTQHFGAVIAEGRKELPNGYPDTQLCPNGRCVITIDTVNGLAFPDANEVQNVHDVIIMVMGPVPPQQPPEGCSPGFWKNHTDKWPPTGFKTTNKFEVVFQVDLNKDGDKFDGPTLLQALKAKGGGINALVRQSVAALLNAAHPTVDSEPAFDTTDKVTLAFRIAFDSGIFEPTKDLLDTSNNRGSELCGSSSEDDPS